MRRQRHRIRPAMQTRRRQERDAAFSRLRMITAYWREDQQRLGLALSERARAIEPGIAAVFRFALDVEDKETLDHGDAH